MQAFPLKKAGGQASRKIAKFINGGPERSRLLLLLGALGVLGYSIFALIPFFIPATDRSHFPPYIALPEGGFDLPNYYQLYSFICLNALAIFAVYLWALKVTPAPSEEMAVKPGRDSTLWVIVGFAGLFHLLMLLTPFLLSTDVFDYIRHGRIFALYHENPLVIPATYFPQDPFFTMGGWVGTGSVYGPLHVYVAGALAWLSGNSVAVNLIAFKAFFIGLNLVNLALIWKIAARLKPGLERKALVFYGWNPFVLTLVVANAHNDILMLTLVLAGLLCYLDRRFFLGVLCITLATLVKFIALPILLVYLALAWRMQRGSVKRLKLLGGSLLIAVGATVVSYLPLWRGRETFTYLTTVGQKTNFTVPSLLRDAVAGHLQLSLSNTIIQLLFAAALAGYLLWHLVGVKDTAGLLSAAAGLAFLTPLALFWFQPWYLTLTLGLIALRPSRLMYAASLAFSFSVVFFDSFWWHAPVDMDIQKPLRIFVVFGPPLAILLVLKAREVLPARFHRLMTWARTENEAGQVADRSITDPSPVQIAAEVSALVLAAAVPMAIVIASSPQLRSLADLIAVKLQLLTRL